MYIHTLVYITGDAYNRLYISPALVRRTDLRWEREQPESVSIAWGCHGTYRGAETECLLPKRMESGTFGLACREGRKMYQQPTVGFGWCLGFTATAAATAVGAKHYPCEYIQ